MGKKKKVASFVPAGSVISQNRKASFNYEILERHEAGIELMGSEVKAIRQAKISLAEAYAHFTRGELFLVGAHVGEYEQAHARNHEPMRRRKLLMHRRELDKLEQAISRQGLTLVPLSLYLKDGRIKVELGLGRGKQMHDKRSSIKDREQKREMDRALRER